MNIEMVNVTCGVCEIEFKVPKEYLNSAAAHSPEDCTTYLGGGTQGKSSLITRTGKEIELQWNYQIAGNADLCPLCSARILRDLLTQEIDSGRIEKAISKQDYGFKAEPFENID